MTSAPVLRMPNFEIPFVIETDACGVGIGAVLMQENHPIAYLSKALSPQNLGLSVYEKELLAVVMAVTKWRHYLVGHHFIIKTDHQALKYLLEQRLTLPLQHKWLTKLLGLDYEIQYKKGSKNGVVDSLSRRKMEETVEMEGKNSFIGAISSIQPIWIQELMDSYNGDHLAQDIMPQLLLDPQSNPEYSLDKGLLKHHHKLYVGAANGTRLKVIQALHSSAVGGQLGQRVCLHKVKSLFYWPNMKKRCVTIHKGV